VNRGSPHNTLLWRLPKQDAVRNKPAHTPSLAGDFKLQTSNLKPQTSNLPQHKHLLLLLLLLLLLSLFDCSPVLWSAVEPRHFVFFSGLPGMDAVRSKSKTVLSNHTSKKICEIQGIMQGIFSVWRW
jgi:hypothetical protein